MATIIIGREKYEVSCGNTIAFEILLLEKLPDTLLFLVEGRPVPMDTVISDNMVIKAIKVASGG